MLLIKCPHCQEQREEQEFSYAGEAHIIRPPVPSEASEAEWGDYVFKRTNTKGFFWEQWSHSAGCRKYFLVERSTITNEIKQIKTFHQHRSEQAQG